MCSPATQAMTNLGSLYLAAVVAFLLWLVVAVWREHRATGDPSTPEGPADELVWCLFAMRTVHGVTTVRRLVPRHRANPDRVYDRARHGPLERIPVSPYQVEYGR